MNEYDVFKLTVDLSDELPKGSQGTIMTKLSEDEFLVEFVRKDGTNIEYKGEQVFMLPKESMEVISSDPAPSIIMANLIPVGKRRTILISISILLVSLHTIYFYHAIRPEIETKKLIQQAIRFLLTGGLLFFVYQGKKWARIVAIVLFSLGAIGALVGMVAIETTTLYSKIPFMVMVVIYSWAVYFFGMSPSFKAFYAYQNEIK